MRKLCSIIAALCLFPLYGAEFVPVTPGQQYDIPIGWCDLMGRGHLTYKDGVYQVAATIKFFGAGTFSHTTSDEVRQFSKLNELPPRDYFNTGASSLSDIPAISEKIEHIARAIETALERKDFKLTIEIVLADDSEVMDMAELKKYLDELGDNKSKYNAYIAGLFDGINQMCRDHWYNENLPTPIIIAAKSDPNFITPNIWDIYSNPLLLAHEFIHLLGSHFEGYELADYPGNGIMNSEDVINALKQWSPNEKMKLLDSDCYEVLASLLFRARPEVRKTAIESAFPEATHSSQLYLETYTNDGYWGLTPDERKDAAKEKVRQLR